MLGHVPRMLADAYRARKERHCRLVLRIKTVDFAKHLIFKSEIPIQSMRPIALVPSSDESCLPVSHGVNNNNNNSDQPSVTGRIMFT